MTFPTSSPSAQGVDPSAISAFVDALEDDSRIEPHGLIIQRHGVRIAEGYWAPHRPEHLRLVYSLSKSFTGTALGLQVGEGRLSLDDLAADHFPDEFAGVDERTRRTRVRHLASMSTGHDREMLLDALLADPEDVVGAFFRCPPPHEPGTIFAYNQPPVLAVASLLQRLAGMRLVDYLRPRVLEPIGIGDLRWTQYQPGIDLGFSGVFTNLDAAARLGQLYLDDGVWDGRRILPEGWVAQASRVQVANPERIEPDWQQGYGFQFWMGQHGYRGDGAFGQYMVVLPEQDMVVAFFSCTDPMQPVLDALWDIVLPALQDSPLPDGPGDKALDARLADLSLATAAQRLGGSPGFSMQQRFDRAAAPSHPTVTAVEVNGDELVLEEDGASLRIPLRAEWTAVSEDLAASATVVDGGRLIADLVFTCTPHRIELVLDAADRTFQARWPAPPLFGLGLERNLTAIHPPAP